MKKDSRRLIIDLIENKKHFAHSWAFRLGATSGIQVALLENFKNLLDFKISLAEYLDEDIFVALDPDRIHSDNLEHLSGIKNRIPKTEITGCIPYSRHKNFNYKQFYDDLPKSGYFDGFGLYYYQWPNNPEYYCYMSPLTGVRDPKIIEDFPLPLIEDEYLSIFKRDVEYIKSKNKVCMAYSGSVYEWSYMLRGRERMYMDYYEEPEIVELIIKKIAGFVELLTQKNIESGIDILCFYDDFGTQQGLQISPNVFRQYYKPVYKKIWQGIKKKYKDKYIFLHSCGNIEKIIPDLVECGLDIINPLQPEVMDISRVTGEYNEELVFWGTMSNQYTLTRGTKDEIFKEVRNRVGEIGSRSRLIIAPSNILGEDAPVENISHFIEACRECCSGRM